MRKTTVVFGLALVAMCSITAQAQMPDPTVSDMQMSMYDIGALKAGDWVEYEQEAYGQKYSMKYACVGIEGDTVWIEYSDAGLAMMHKGTAILVAVNKGDRKVTKAYWGKPGEKGKELKVTETPKGDGSKPAETPKITGTCKISSEKCSAAGKDFDCEKMAMETSMTMNGAEYKSKTTMWKSDAVPFGYYMDDKGEWKKAMGDIKMEGEAKCKGGVVKTETEMSGMKTVMVLKGIGTDAKQTIQK